MTMRASASGRWQPMKVGDTERMSHRHSSRSPIYCKWKLRRGSGQRAPPRPADRARRIGATVERSARSAPRRRRRSRKRSVRQSAPRSARSTLFAALQGALRCSRRHSLVLSAARRDAPEALRGGRKSVFFLQWVKTDPTVKQVFINKRNFFGTASERNSGVSETSQERGGR